MMLWIFFIWNWFHQIMKWYAYLHVCGCLHVQKEKHGNLTFSVKAKLYGERGPSDTWLINLGMLICLCWHKLLNYYSTSFAWKRARNPIELHILFKTKNGHQAQIAPLPQNTINMMLLLPKEENLICFCSCDTSP